jgi:hypothetical protein
MFDIFYQKNTHNNLFNTLEKEDMANMNNVQNYLPIYKNFFSTTDDKILNINLNHKYHIDEINKKETHNIYEMKIKHEENIITRKVFIKFSPLLDPIKYLSGKYSSYENKKIINLPDLSNNECHKKILDMNNAAYVDSFFSYLTSRTLHEHSFIHGLDFYGTFLGIQNEFKINIAEDLEYLLDSKFFQENRDILFNFDTKSLFSDTESRTNKKPLVLTEKVDLNVDYIDNKLFEGVFELTEENINNHNHNHNHNNKMTLMSDLSFNKTTNTNSSDSTCSSRVSDTNDSDNSKNDNDVESYRGSSSECSTYSSFSDEVIECDINKFPTSIICLEKMDDTLDTLLGDEFDLEESDGGNSMTDSIEELDDEEWRSCLFQIIMTLVAYQKMFDFTHNDLHTNNIMYNKTDKTFLFYKYKNVYYKVPTFGRIYKIIDFGRAIYRYKDKIICSDSYHPKGDAATQYNCKPYLNENKPTLNPNKSFDLCRLGCALYDYFLEDLEDKTVVINPIGKLIEEWCKDDNDKNILYKKNGDERYPDFKLYKMIARTVHKHTPDNQLDRVIFYKYQTKKKKIKKKPIMNIDNFPVYFTD